MRQAFRISPALIAILFLMTFSGAPMNAQTASSPAAQQNPPTVAEAEEFMRNAETRLNDLSVKASRASWVQSNFITDDTEQMAADANEVLIGVTTELAKQATRYDNLRSPTNSSARCCC